NIMGMNNNIYVLRNSESNRSISQITDDILEKTKGYDFDVSIQSGAERSNMMTSGIEIEIKGENLETLNDITKDFISIIEKIEGTENVSSSIGENMPEIKVL